MPTTARSTIRGSRLLGATALLAATVLALGATPETAAAGAPAARGGGARLVTVFPSNALTVPDRAQRTGLRVDLPLPDCRTQATECSSVRLLDQLDGFDLDVMSRDVVLF